MTNNSIKKINSSQTHTQFIYKLRKIRRDLHLRQEDAAKLAGVSREAYLRAENLQADPRLSTVLAMAAGLGYELVLKYTENTEHIARQAHGAKQAREAATRAKRMSSSAKRAQAQAATFKKVYGDKPSDNFNTEGVTTGRVSCDKSHESQVSKASRLVPARGMTNPPHPGVLLREDVIPAMNLTVFEAAVKLGVTGAALSRVLNGNAPIDGELAARIERWLGADNGGRAELWLAQQAAYDQWQARVTNTERATIDHMEKQNENQGAEDRSGDNLDNEAVPAVQEQPGRSAPAANPWPF